MAEHFTSFHILMEPTLDDLTELKRLLGLGSTPYVEALLKAEIQKIEPKFATVKAPEPAKPAAPVRRYQSITSYAFSDSKKTAEIMIREIRSLEQAKIEFEPQKNGFSIAVIREEQNLPNLKLVVSPIKEIVPADSTYKIRRETLTVILAKKKEETWMKLKDTSLTPKKEEKKKPEDDVDAKENPNAALMNMMKKLYDEGDDEMKRTISKAMWEAQHKKPEDEEKKDKK